MYKSQCISSKDRHYINLSKFSYQSIYSYNFGVWLNYFFDKCVWLNYWYYIHELISHLFWAIYPFGHCFWQSKLLSLEPTSNLLIRKQNSRGTISKLFLKKNRGKKKSSWCSLKSQFHPCPDNKVHFLSKSAFLILVYCYLSQVVIFTIHITIPNSCSLPSRNEMKGLSVNTKEHSYMYMHMRMHQSKPKETTVWLLLWVFW